MTHFNFNQSLRNLVNNCKSLFILSLALTTFGVGEMWGISKTKLTAYVEGGGKVCVNKSSSSAGTYSSSSSATNEHGFFDVDKEDTYYIWLSPNSGYSCTGYTIENNGDRVNSCTLSGDKYYIVKIKGYISEKETKIKITFKATFYGKAKAYADPAAGGGTWISLNGNWPTSDANYIAEDNSTKNENTTTAPTFSAQYDAKAKDGYEFVGWYTANNGSGTKTSSTARYTENFTASSVDQNAPTTITRYAYFKALQYYYFKAQAGKVGTGNVYASFSDGSYSATSDIKTERATTLAQSQSTSTYTVYFKAEETDAAYHFAGWYTDAACTELNRVSTNLSYSEQISGSTATTEASAKTITRYAKFVQELTPEVTANYSGSPKAMFVDDEISSAFSFLNTSTFGSGLSVVSSNDNIIVYDVANNKVIAKNEGTATLTFTQTKQEIIKAGEFSFTFTVSKITNTLTADATHSMKVDETWTSVISGKNSDATVTTTSSDETVAYYDVTNDKIVAQNTGNQSFNSKVVTITISQAATYKYTAAEKTITVTVNKHDNHISINGSQDGYQASIYMEAQQSINLTATNTDYASSLITATQTAGNTIATLNAAQTQVTSNHNLGDATWTVFQPENYKYKAANASFTIHVVTQVEATDCYVLNDNSEHSFSTGLSDTKGHFDTPIALDGPAYQLTYEAKKDKLGINQFVAQYSTNSGSSWTDINMPDLSDDYQSFGPFNIPDNTTHIRFGAKTGGTLSKYYRNVRVTRKTYLNASDFTINTQSDNTTLIYPGTMGMGAFQVDYSLANGGDLKLVCDNPKFTISKTSQSNVDCKTGSFNVDMTYTSQEAGTDYAHIVIYNNVYRKEITVTGITQKHQQTLNWKENFDKMSKGSEEKNAASSSHGLVTYTSTNTNVIRVDNDANGYATILVAVAKGESEITATAAGDDEYDSKSISKTISVTEDHVQYIIWNQSLMGLKYEQGGTKTLTAYATSEEEGNGASSRPITYTSDNTSVVSISGNQLIIQGIGTATITARQAGGTIAGITYEAAEKTNKVIVKDPSAKCESFVYEQGNEAEEFFQMNTNEINGTEHTLNGEPAKLTFYAKREYWNLAIDYSKGNIVVDAYTSSGWQQVLDCGEPSIGSYAEYSVNLNRDVTKIRFRRPKGGQGYHYIAGAKIERARYIETTTPPVFQANVGEVQEHTISLSYSNITSDLLLTLAGGANSRFSIDKTSIEGECGDAQKNVTLTISYAPTQDTEGNVEGKEQETLNITDGTTIRQVTLYGKASKVDQHIVWDINDNNNIYTIEQVTLTAKTETNLHQAAGELAYHIVGASTEGCGTIDNNILSFSKNGIVYVEAYTIASDKYNTATSVTKSWTVSKTPTKVTTNPTISGDIISGTDISSLVLKDGAAQNTVNNQAVEGTFAITGGNLVNVGQQSLTITFTPNNTDMYESCTTTITVNVVQREATADEVGIPSAAPITYGNAINTSLLSGNGSLAGTWTWVDEDANKATPNVGTVNDLNVVFTPNDGNVKPVTATVSLSVNKAQPVISWTGETTYEWGEIANLFSASNNAAVTMTSLNETIAKIEDNKIIPVSAGTVTIHGEIEENDNYLAASLDQTITINAPADNMFTNAAGDNDWNNPSNWTSGIVPEKLNDVDVVVNGEMTIDEEIHVNSLTIESGASVKVVVNGDLTVQGQSQERIEYGDLFVKNGGEVILPEGNSRKMMVHNLVIESSIGTSDGTSTSGQISNLDALAFDNGGDAYIDINLDPSGNADDSQWYCFTVPFPVDIATGIARKELDGSFKVLQDHTNFDILRYNPTQRLNTGKGWEYYHGTLQPGEFYLIAIDGTNNVYSFRKKKDAELISANTMSLAVNGDNTNVNANWNAVGNPTLQKVTASFSNKIVQVYVNGGSRYQAVSTDDANFVVGCPFFIQASVAENLTLTADNSKSQFYAPARQDDNTNTLFCVRFGQNNHFSDQIFVTASEQALNQYEIGYDVAKIGVSKQSAQLWVNAYNQQLCAHEAVLTNDLADMALTLFAPKAGEYNLSVARENMPTDETLYLTQNGQIIWNLSESDYTIEAVKGDNNQYGLRLISSHRITTDNEQLESRNRAEKFIMNNQLYILRDGQLYDATGKKIQ